MKTKNILKKLAATTSAIALLMFFMSSQIANAATYTWDGGGTTNNWSDCDNWNTNVCPTAADNVTFNATSLKNSIIDAGTTDTILNLTIANTYTGTISQQRSLIADTYSQAAGNYIGGPHDLTVRGNFTVSGGVFTAPSSTLDIWLHFTVGDANQFVHNNGTVIFGGTNSSRYTVICNGTEFHTVKLNWAKNVRENCSLPLGHNPVMGVGNGWNYSRIYGEIYGTGTLSVVDPNNNRGFQILDGGSVSGFSAINSDRVMLSNSQSDFSSLESMSVNLLLLQNNSTFTSPEQLNIAEYLTTDSTSTFEHNNGTVEFTGTTNAINGDNTFYNLKKVATQPSMLTFAAGSTQTILGTLTLRGTDENNLLSLVSSTPGTSWNLNASGSQNLSFLSVEDSNNTGEPLYAANSTFSGDTTNWSLPLPGPAQPKASQSGEAVMLAKSGINHLIITSLSLLVILLSTGLCVFRKKFL